MTACIGEATDVPEGEEATDDGAGDVDDNTASGLITLLSAKVEYVCPGVKSSRRTLPNGDVGSAEHGLEELESSSLNGVAVSERAGACGR